MLSVSRQASRHVHQFVRLTDTMGIVPSAALGIVINNHGSLGVTAKRFGFLGNPCSK